MRYKLLSIFVLFISLFTIFTIQAQEGRDLEPNYDPDFLRELAPTYNIVYFIAEDAETGEYDSTEWMREQLAVDVVNTWEELLFYEELLGIDGLIIHNSVAASLDSDWLARQYLFGLVVTAINMPAPTYAALIQRDGLSDRYELVANDTVFVTSQRLKVRDVLRGTDLGGVGIWETAGSTVNQLSTEEGQRAFIALVEDIRQLEHDKRYLIEDMLENN